MVGKGHEYQVMADCERKLWWYRSLHDLTVKKIRQYGAFEKSYILDAGCGTGGMLSVLKENGFTNITGFDFSTDAIEFSKNTYQFDVKRLDILECDKFYEAQSFDIIISNDVLCLLSEGDDKIALEKLLSLLKPGVYLFLNLPAGRAFKGIHDIVVGIVKRYTVSLLTELASGMAKIKELLFWPFLVSPLIFSVRFMQRLQMQFKDNTEALSDVSLPPDILNRILYSITRWENHALGKKPWGSSVFVTLQKSL